MSTAGSVPESSSGNVEPAPIPVGVLCPDCGYDLRGLTSDRCPECGFDLAPLRSAESQIPWVRRRELGRLRAYWRTVWAVFWRPARFCVELARPVSLGDARRFCWLTRLHAFVGVGSLSVLLGWAAKRSGDAAAGEIGWTLLAINAWVAAMLVLLPALAADFFEDRSQTPERRQRVRALSQYAWAPAAAGPAAVLILALGFVLPERGDVDLAASCLGFALWVTTMVVAGLRVERFLRHAVEPQGGLRLARLVLFGLVSSGFGFLLVLIPLAIFYVRMIICSLR